MKTTLMSAKQAAAYSEQHGVNPAHAQTEEGTQNLKRRKRTQQYTRNAGNSGRRSSKKQRQAAQSTTK